MQKIMFFFNGNQLQECKTCHKKQLSCRPMVIGETTLMVHKIRIRNTLIVSKIIICNTVMIST